MPFEGESAVTIALKHVNERPVPPSMINPAVSPELEGVVMRALEKDPQRRFPDADAFIAALEHARGRPATVVEEAVVYDGGYAPPPYEELYEEEAAGRRWWLWLLALGLVARCSPAAATTCSRATPGRRRQPCPTSSAPSRPRPSPRSSAPASSTDVVKKTSAERPEGTVISTDPTGGIEADKGSTVRVNVSSGPGTVDVPSVDGLTRSQARDAAGAGRLRDRGAPRELRHRAVGQGDPHEPAGGDDASRRARR